MDLVKMLKDCDLKVTPQRLCILKILNMHEHPSIDKLYARIKEEYPSISLATVYKNINTLKDEGLVVEIDVPNQKACYDIYIKPHLHLVCKNCLSIKDIDFDEDLFACQDLLKQKVKKDIDYLAVAAYVKECENCQ